MKVHVNGGLGNQLFQFAYAHRLASSGQKAKVEMSVEQKTLSDPSFQLGKLTDICSHALHIREFRISVIAKITHKIPFKNFGLNFLLSMLEYRHPDFLYLGQEVPKHGKHFGYFQHWKYVEESWPMISKEIYEFIEQGKFRKATPVNRNCIVLHVRRGDYVKYKELYGLLDLEYYRGALEQLKINDNQELVVISDDFISGNYYALSLGAKKLFTPENQSELEALSLMRNASHVIAANSTFSWWGAFLCFKNGGTAVLPSDYFVTSNPLANSALHFPGATVALSSFEQS